MLRSWSEADDVSLLCCRLQGLQAWLRLKGGEKILAKNVIPNLVTKRLSSENFKWGSLGHLRAVGSLFTSALSMPVTERDGNNGTGRQAGRHTGRAGALVR